MLIKIGEEYIKSKSKLSNANQSKEYDNCTFKPVVKTSFRHKLNKIETPNAIVSINGEGFQVQQNIENIRFSKKNHNKSTDNQMFIDGQINIKIIKKSEKQQEAASIRSKINKVHSKPKNYMPKSNMSSRKALSKITKPQDYNGKLGIFKSKVPMPYKPIPTKLQTVNSGEIQISASPIETPVSLAETKPEKSIRNKELENVRGQVLNSMTEGDEVLFKSVSSFEDNNKDTSINNPTQEESKINLKAAQDLLNSTKQRIDEIEKDLMLVNNAESPNQLAGVTPKSFSKVPQLNRDQLKAVQGEKSEDSQINKSK